MLDVLKNRNFALLWTAGLISMIGNWVMLAALPFYIFDLTGSALATSGVFIAFMAPGIVLGSIAGVFVDRWDRVRTMMIINVLQGLAILLLMLVRSSDTIWLVYLVLVLEASLAQFFITAENALLPRLVSESHLMAANAMNGMNDNLARLAGPAVGGALLAFSGFTYVVVIDALSYGIAATLLLVLMLSMRQHDEVGPPVAEPDPSQTLRSTMQSLWGEWREGLSIVLQSPILNKTFLVVGFSLLADAMISAILVVYLQEEVGMGSAEFGYIMTARGVGGILGAVIGAQIGQRISSQHLLSSSLIGLSLSIFVAIQLRTLVPLLIIMVIAGIPAMILFVSIQTLVQQHTLRPIWVGYLVFFRRY